MIFVRSDTGERKEFAEDSYTVDNSTMHTEGHRDIVHVHFYKAKDGCRIDRMPDGSFQDKYGVVWLPE